MSSPIKMARERNLISMDGWLTTASDMDFYCELEALRIKMKRQPDLSPALEAITHRSQPAWLAQQKLVAVLPQKKGF